LKQGKLEAAGKTHDRGQMTEIESQKSDNRLLLTCNRQPIT